MPGILEICCTSYDSAIIAQQAGANRIELCDNIFEGGTTPSIGIIRQVCSYLGIPCYILFRPRGGNFIYSDKEFEVMKEDIRYCREAGVQGIVSGILSDHCGIDVDRTTELVNLAGDMDFTFHRAFDLVVDPMKSLQEVISTGASRILTSGLKNTVGEGMSMIKQLIKWSNSEINIMAGGGLSSVNISELINETGCMEFHTTAKSWKSTAVNCNSVSMNSLKDIPEDKIMVTSAEEINKLREIIDKI